MEADERAAARKTLLQMADPEDVNSAVFMGIPLNDLAADELRCIVVWMDKRMASERAIRQAFTRTG